MIDAASHERDPTLPPPARRLRILHLIATADPASGGPIEGILRQNDATRHLAERTLATLDPPDAPFLATIEIDVRPLGEDRPSRWGPVRHYGFTSRLTPWLKRHAGDYDVVIVNGLWNFVAFA